MIAKKFEFLRRCKIRTDRWIQKIFSGKKDHKSIKHQNKFHQKILISK